MLLVQKFLETKSFSDLIKEHGVYVSFSKSGHKFSLNYDQIEAKENDPLSQECRGLILSTEDGSPLLPAVSDRRSPSDHLNIVPGKTKILAFPMRRFFNYGQGAAALIDLSDPYLSVLEKLDGTLCILYYDSFASKWCMATRSVPEADLLMDNGIFTFRTLFEKALLDTCGNTFDQFTEQLNQNITYCFELTTPYNRIVVCYPENRVTLLAARRNDSLEEFNLELLISKKFVDNVYTNTPYDLCGVPFVQTHARMPIDELVNWVSTLNPMDHEGVVVRDSNFNRIKIKNAAYTAYSRVRDSLGTSERNCLEMILLEKEDDVIPFLPEEIVKNLIKIKEALKFVLREHDETYLAVRQECDKLNPGDKKTFAVAIQKTSGGKLWKAPFFNMWDGKSSNMKDFIQKNKKDGTWGNSFLDKLLDLSKAFYI
jgi:hypothetical protein